MTSSALPRVGYIIFKAFKQPKWEWDATTIYLSLRGTEKLRHCECLEIKSEYFIYVLNVVCKWNLLSVIFVKRCNFLSLFHLIETIYGICFSAIYFLFCFNLRRTIPTTISHLTFSISIGTNKQKLFFTENPKWPS